MRIQLSDGNDPVLQERGEKMLKVVIIDNQILFRQGLASLLSSQPDFEIIGEADTAESALILIKGTPPDLVLYDPVSENGNGFYAIQQIVSDFPDTSVIVLTHEESDELLFDSLRVGADGFLLKNTPITLLLETLRNTRQGEAALNGKLTARILDEFKRMINQPGQVIEGSERLTSREVDVLREIGRGATNAEIAERLTISINTVKVHVHNILDKLSLFNRAEAGQMARRLGLLAPPEKPDLP